MKTFEVILKTGEVLYTTVTRGTLEHYGTFEGVAIALEIEEGKIFKVKRI